MPKKLKDILRPYVHLARSIKFNLSIPLKHLRKNPLKDFRFNYFSQNGEDGVVEEIFKRLKINSGYVVEFGAWDGKHASNTFQLVKTNPKIKAVYIEGDTERYSDLLRTRESFPNQIIPVNTFVSPSGENSLDSILRKNSVPIDFEILSIDVDGIDYQIWEGLKEYKPKVVIIEIHSSIPLGVDYIHDGKTKWHTSFESMRKLGNSKGYVCIHHAGNMFFAHTTILQKLGIPNLTVDEQNKLFAQRGSNYLNQTGENH